MRPEIIKCNYVVYQQHGDDVVIPLEYYDDSFGPITEGGHGWLARLSMPGYLDCTEWSVYETEREAIQGMLETFGSENGEPESWEAEAEEFLKGETA